MTAFYGYVGAECDHGSVIGSELWECACKCAWLMCGYGSVFLGECYGSVPVCMEMPAVLVENIGAECDYGSVIASVECRASLFHWWRVDLLVGRLMVVFFEYFLSPPLHFLPLGWWWFNYFLFNHYFPLLLFFATGLVMDQLLFI